MQIRSANTVQVIHAVISGIFNEAIDLGYSNNNPAHGLLKKILPSKKKRRISMPDPFTQQDLEKFLEAAWVNLPKPFPLILETMAMTGMRLGEALAMSVDNLDALNCHYKITETTKLGRFGPPKTGERLVDLEETLLAKLEAHIKQLRRERVPLGTPAQYLFPGITQRMVQRAVERACIAARLRRRHPHDLRHTYATILLMSHVSPAYIQKQLGHHSISMTVDTYGHWIPGEGKVDLTKALRPKAKPGNPFKLVTQGQR
jgi:integrase